MFKQTLFALVCLASGLLAGGGQAATLSVSAQSPSGNVFADANGHNAWYVGASYTLAGQSRHNVAAGVFRLKAFDATSHTSADFMAFCLSPLAWLRLPLDYARGNDLSSAAFNRLSALSNGAWGSIKNSKTAGAFQLAVWEIVSEAGTLNLNSGAFVLTGTTSKGAKTLAQSWLKKVENGTFQGNPTVITTLKADNTQHLLTRDELPVPVPLPAGLGLMMLALGSFGAVALRKQRRAA